MIGIGCAQERLAKLAADEMNESLGCLVGCKMLVRRPGRIVVSPAVPVLSPDDDGIDSDLRVTSRIGAPGLAECRTGERVPRDQVVDELREIARHSSATTQIGC